MTADDGVEAARAFAGAAIVPLHFEGGSTSESRGRTSPRRSSGLG